MHIENGYYYAVPDVENEYYKIKCMQVDNFESVELQVKRFNEKLNVYNELKDICESMIGKIAELRGIKSDKIREEVEAPE